MDFSLFAGFNLKKKKNRSCEIETRGVRIAMEELSDGKYYRGGKNVISYH